MILITKNKYFKYLLYISVYLAEGIASLFILIVLPIYLKNYKGLSDLSIAILAGISLLPLILKPLVAVLSDNYIINSLGGKRKSYMLMGFILNGVTLSLIGIVDPVLFLYLFLIIWIFQSLGIVFMDVAIDALVTETFNQTNEKLNANIVFQLAAISSAFIVFPIAYLCEINSVHIGINTPQIQFSFFFGGNFDFGFLLAGGICFCLIAAILILKEPEECYSKPKFIKKDLIKFLKSKKVPLLLVMFFLLQIDAGLTDFTVDPFLRTLGFTSGIQILAFSPTLVFILLGTLASKWFIKKGIIRCLTIFSACFAFFYIIIAILTFLISPIIPIFYFISAAFLSILSAAGMIMYLTLAMNAADKKLAATTFVIFVTMIGLGRILGIIIAGIIPFGIYLKMGVIFSLCAIIIIIRIPMLIKLNKLEKKEVKN